MRVSFSWLRHLVDVTTKVEELSEKLSLTGFEVESIEDLAQNAQGVVVGFVEKNGDPSER